MQDYQDLMARVHKMIAAVLKAEKGERETRRKSLAIVHGFDNTKCMKTNLEIKDGRNPCSSYRKLKMAPPIKGVHRRADKQVPFGNIHRFLNHREWGEVEQDKGIGGIAWIELFILFDTSEARTPNGRHVKNLEAEKGQKTGRTAKQKARQVHKASSSAIAMSYRPYKRN